jgi:hypothetical protein
VYAIQIFNKRKIKTENLLNKFSTVWLNGKWYWWLRKLIEVNLKWLFNLISKMQATVIFLFYFNPFRSVLFHSYSIQFHSILKGMTDVFTCIRSLENVTDYIYISVGEFGVALLIVIPLYMTRLFPVAHIHVHFHTIIIT